MAERSTVISNHVQDRNSLAWSELCAYIDRLAASKEEEFAPLEVLGPELFAQIYTLPESIATLKQVRKMWLYGSNLKRIPPEIGEMTALEYFDPYTSYDLHWFPYEIVQCQQLKDSRVSTRTLYGNYKNRLTFPDLHDNPVRYGGDAVHCSVCKKEISYADTNQAWISLCVGTDVLPLLANLCSKECESKLPQPPPDYLPFPHKGGADLQQPEDEEWPEDDARWNTYATDEDSPTTEPPPPAPNPPVVPDDAPRLIKLIRKIWER